MEEFNGKLFKIVESKGKNALQFFVLFMRFEFALKHRGFKRIGNCRQIEADWPVYAKKNKRKLCRILQLDSAKLLFDTPPGKETGPLEFDAIDALVGQDRNLKELFKLVKSVRNNLFHGGKEIPLLGRDHLLIDASIDILIKSLEFDSETRSVFYSFGPVQE